MAILYGNDITKHVECHQREIKNKNQVAHPFGSLSIRYTPLRGFYNEKIIDYWCKVPIWAIFCHKIQGYLYIKKFYDIKYNLMGGRFNEE